MRNFIGVMFAVGALAPALGAQQQVPGWVLEQKTSMTMEGATIPISQTRSRLTTANGDLRTDMIEGPTAGEYTLVLAHGRMMLLVVPARRVAREMTLDSAALSSIMPVGMTYGRGAMKVDTLGDGPVMVGYPTLHYRVTPTRVLNISMPGFGGDSSERLSFGFVTDYYVTDQLHELEAAGSRQRPQSSAPGAVRGFTGFPLRTETHMVMGGGGMKATSVTEVTSVSTSAVDPALFTVPAGYARVSFADEMRNMRAHLDSLRARNDSVMRDLNAKYPGLADKMKTMRNAILGVRDTTITKPPEETPGSSVPPSVVTAELLPSAPVAGWSVEFKSVLRTLDTSHPVPPHERHDRWIVTDQRVRIESGAPNSGRSYAVYDGKTKMLRTPDAKRGVIDELSIDANTLRELARSWQLTVLGEVRRTDMGDGPRILGHRTRHVRLTSVPCERFYRAAGKRMLDTITLDLFQARDVPGLEAMSDP